VGQRAGNKPTDQQIRPNHKGSTSFGVDPLFFVNDRYTQNTSNKPKIESSAMIFFSLLADSITDIK
ncbi:MAG: hypothetical protein JAZ19_20775, partial [Candidatus Thiodiazotropha taylori]|nr:hypothetical protein [Candidatus Thiodiazotropha taylori]